MKEGVQHIYWDTCVFIAYLNDERDAYGSTINDIGQHLREAKDGKCQIYTSTITIAEVTQRFMDKSDHGTFNEFLSDFSGVIIPISPDPNVMNIASHLRSQKYLKGDGNRPLLTPDAIHLATGIALRDTFQVELDAFHTFDKGNKNGAAGKSVPLIGFAGWCGDCSEDVQIKKILALPPKPPMHRSPELVG